MLPLFTAPLACEMLSSDPRTPALLLPLCPSRTTQHGAETASQLRAAGVTFRSRPSASPPLATPCAGRDARLDPCRDATLAVALAAPRGAARRADVGTSLAATLAAPRGGAATGRAVVGTSLQEWASNDDDRTVGVVLRCRRADADAAPLPLRTEKLPSAGASKPAIGAR